MKIALIVFFIGTGFSFSLAAQIETVDLPPSLDSQAETPLQSAASEDSKIETDADRPAKFVNRYQEAAEALELAISQPDWRELRDGILIAIDLLPKESYQARKLEQIVIQVSQSIDREESLFQSFRDQLEQIAEQLAFTPVQEADLPAGFPAPTPVGEIELKVYPRHRVVQTELKGNPWEKKNSSSFVDLLNHIQANEIAMTTPVQMIFTAADGQTASARSMAFIFESPSIGESGKRGDVQVIDVGMMKVITVGMRGEITTGKISKARSELMNWAKDRSIEGRLREETRVLAYNSPDVAKENQFFEVQVELVD